MKKIKNTLLLVLLSLSISMFTPVEMNAQCPMCRMSAEADLKNGGTMAKGLNKGILFMLSMPYILVGGIGLVWYKNKSRLANTNLDDENNLSEIA